VTVFVGDDARFRGKVNLDVKAVLESWRSREDEKLVYAAYVEVDRAGGRLRSEDTERLTRRGRGRRAPREGSLRDLSAPPPLCAQPFVATGRAVN